MSHRCPGPGCDKTVPDHLLMCRKHWYQVPRPIRQQVYADYQNGRGVGSPQLAASQRTAIDSLKAGI